MHFEEIQPFSEPVVKIETRSLTKDTLNDIVENCKVYMLNEGGNLENALAKVGLTKTTAPVPILKALYKFALESKKTLFSQITPEDKAQYVRDSDFEAYMKAVDSGDISSQVALSKVLRADNQMNMNAQAPSLVVNIGALEGILNPPEAPIIVDLKPDKIERE